MLKLSDSADDHELIIVSNRLPVDRVENADGTTSWEPSPGGLVTAVEPIVRELGCQWVGWPGGVDDDLAPFTVNSMQLIPVTLSEEEFTGFYEGFSNGTLWPLYHDVISPPVYVREWWKTYLAVNKRFAQRVAEIAPREAVVWVHDYQLQLVPGLLRELRPDVTIAFFLHIPFPPPRLFHQLPWRRRIIEGLLGADVIGFQREEDAVNFRGLAATIAGAHVDGEEISLRSSNDLPTRSLLAREFPISIDVEGFSRLAAREDIQQRAQQIRRDLGGNRTILLGVDRLDYTKGIRHRLQAYEELLEEEELSVDQSVLVQIASPSREHVDAYRQLRDEVELTVGRINGEHGTLEHAPLTYLYRGHSRDEMVAMYLAADVLVVTPLRDGMNLVAKEYVACRNDETGALILSEFAGAADELRDALLVNPHDIERMKAAMVRAVHMPADEQRRRMIRLRMAIRENNVTDWAENFLRAVERARATNQREADRTAAPSGEEQVSGGSLPGRLDAELQRIAQSPTLLVACDFDGTVSPLVARPQDARILPLAQQALDRLTDLPRTHVTILTGRGMESLRNALRDSTGWVVSASHGAELVGLHAEDGDTPRLVSGGLTAEEERLREWIVRRLTRVLGDEPGVRFETKPLGVALHVREVTDPERAQELLAAATALGSVSGIEVRHGKMVREFVVRKSDKGSALTHIRSAYPQSAVVFLGDDVTDEDVFTALLPHDVGIKVGDGDTYARERVPSPADAAAVLTRLAELRTRFASRTHG